MVPLVRAGHQLRVLLKLLELCIPVATGHHSSEDFLPCWSGFSNSGAYFSPLTFSRDDVEAIVLARDSYYKRMNEKLEGLLFNFEIRHHQVINPLVLVSCITCAPFFLFPFSPCCNKRRNFIREREVKYYKAS